MHAWSDAELHAVDSLAEEANYDAEKMASIMSYGLEDALEDESEKVDDYEDDTTMQKH